RVGARAWLGDRPRADLLEREKRERPALLLRHCAARHDRARREAHADAERRHHPGAPFAELDDRDHAHGDLHGRLLAAARLHVGDAERGDELAQHFVRRLALVLDGLDLRLHLRLAEAADRVADRTMCLGPIDHERSILKTKVVLPATTSSRSRSAYSTTGEP